MGRSRQGQRKGEQQDMYCKGLSQETTTAKPSRGDPLCVHACVHGYAYSAIHVGTHMCLHLHTGYACDCGVSVGVCVAGTSDVLRWQKKGSSGSQTRIRQERPCMSS